MHDEGVTAVVYVVEQKDVEGPGGGGGLEIGVAVGREFTE
jgi:hypothetical protein